jgi:hypothetical protein
MSLVIGGTHSRFPMAFSKDCNKPPFFFGTDPPRHLQYFQQKVDFGELMKSFYH